MWAKIPLAWIVAAFCEYLPVRDHNAHVTVPQNGTFAFVLNDASSFREWAFYFVNGLLTLLCRCGPRLFTMRACPVDTVDWCSKFETQTIFVSPWSGTLPERV